MALAVDMFEQFCPALKCLPAKVALVSKNEHQLYVKCM